MFPANKNEIKPKHTEKQSKLSVQSVNEEVTDPPCEVPGLQEGFEKKERDKH